MSSCSLSLSLGILRYTHRLRLLIENGKLLAIVDLWDDC